MKHIKAVGFDLFNTLITMEPVALKDALGRLTSSVRSSFRICECSFRYVPIDTGFPSSWADDEVFMKNISDNAIVNEAKLQIETRNVRILKSNIFFIFISSNQT